MSSLGWGQGSSMWHAEAQKVQVKILISVGGISQPLGWGLLLPFAHLPEASRSPSAGAAPAFCLSCRGRPFVRLPEARGKKHGRPKKAPKKRTKGHRGQKASSKGYEAPKSPETEENKPKEAKMSLKRTKGNEIKAQKSKMKGKTRPKGKS